MHILRKLKHCLTLHACKPIVGDSQNNIINLKNGILGHLKKFIRLRKELLFQELMTERFVGQLKMVLLQK